MGKYDAVLPCTKSFSTCSDFKKLRSYQQHLKYLTTPAVLVNVLLTHHKCLLSSRQLNTIYPSVLVYSKKIISAILTIIIVLVELIILIDIVND